MRFGYRKIMFVALGVLVVLGAAGLAIASTGAKDVTVYYRDIRMVLNGVEVRSSDAEPMILDGRTYVPLRAVGEAMGAKVEWDGDNSRVLINTSKGSAPVSELMILGRQNASGFSVQDAIMHEVTYPGTLALRCTDSQQGCSYDLALNGQYSTLDAVVGLTDQSDSYATSDITISADDKQLAHFTVLRAAKPTPIKLNIKGALRLHFTMTGSWNYPVVAFTGTANK